MFVQRAEVVLVNLLGRARQARMPHTVEGTTSFRLRIVAARFIGQAATIFRAPAGLTAPLQM